jgi:exonuclease SbcD
MKIIHTADWHIGKIIYGEYMLDDQRYILTQFLNYLKEEPVDALIISGDVYDRAVSHVEELKERINDKIEVIPTSEGSIIKY